MLNAIVVGANVWAVSVPFAVACSQSAMPMVATGMWQLRGGNWQIAEVRKSGEAMGEAGTGSVGSAGSVGL